MSEKKPVTIVNGEYTMEKEIGRGSFAMVFKGYRSSDRSEHIAIKAVSRSKLKNKKLLENLEIEIAILKKIKHPHIVGLMDCERTATDFFLVMEYCALGDLTFLIRKRKELTENHPLLKSVFEKYPPPSPNHNGLHRAFIVNYLQQLASSLRFLRTKNLVHRDIKPQNLLLATPLMGYHDAQSFHESGFVGIYNLPILKIADFGFARFLPNTSLAETLCGSPLYMAPEILNYQKYNAKADLWSVGAVLYEMCCGKPPFKASNHLELYKKIKRANDVITFPSQCEVEQELKDLICGLLTFDPANRMGFAEFFENKLVTEDLSPYEMDEAVPELETKSKDVVESNMFISEYLAKPPPPSSKRQSNGTRPLVKEDLKPLTSHDVQQRQLETAAGHPNANNDTSGSNKNNNNNSNNNALINPSRTVRGNPSMGRAKKIGSSGSGSDLMLEKEYVVVEKKTVEVNALADEFAQAGPGPAVLQQQQQQQQQQLPNSRQGTPASQRQRNLSDGSSPMAHVGAQPQQQAFLTGRTARTSNSSGGSNSRRASLVDRRLSLTSLNPSSALSRALGIASTRLFGTTPTNQNQQQQSSNSSSPNYRSSLLNPKIFQDLTENIILRVEHLQGQLPQKMDGNSVILWLETLSAKAFVVFSYAEVKFSQIVPLPKNSKDHHFEKRLSNSSCAVEEEEDDEPDFLAKQGFRNRSASTTSSVLNELPTNEMLQLCTEAVILYMKALSILAKAMQITSTWWYESQDKVYSLRLNLLVQWIRERFNESLEKADFLRVKINELKTACASDRTLIKPEGAKETLETNDQLKQDEGDSPQIDEIGDEEPVYLEKMLYDRSLEISKAAAKLEIQGEHLNNCELAYATSLWMLKTLLDETSDEYLYNEQDIVTTGILDEQDKRIIKKYIDSIANRLKALRHKMNHG
ncbi:ZYRO0G19074p [Zygosaccharomyces rouxii]|uniref:Serine/threonine-protein kinase ATG1 n=1 Tax=Zygosaccharomyces rouxii (strain ATCC 2623 / CBS 732 / NBRC 1130 / NCYC 568 / NRRL Y-229) TaxID=559307 RepID=C5E193_ZYGRC|nr:uncharacterized protein ZYRO0G19074g [Zygosaccharomyces rouxii]KAH9202870.1 kinase-like domain-containing protein [Zygosaccharomyces rouxii]CAR29877.1 ZYRO0G19074p [Zygosaccharomyces rouxii]